MAKQSACCLCVLPPPLPLPPPLLLLLLFRSAGDWKRNYLSALSASVDTVLPFLVKLLQVSRQQVDTGVGEGWGFWAARRRSRLPPGWLV